MGQKGFFEFQNPLNALDYLLPIRSKNVKHLENFDGSIIKYLKKSNLFLSLTALSGLISFMGMIFFFRNWF